MKIRRKTASPYGLAMDFLFLFLDYVSDISIVCV